MWNPLSGSLLAIFSSYLEFWINLFLSIKSSKVVCIQSKHYVYNFIVPDFVRPYAERHDVCHHKGYMCHSRELPDRGRNRRAWSLAQVYASR